MPTETIVMAYLTSGATSTDIALLDGMERAWRLPAQTKPPKCGTRPRANY